MDYTIVELPEQQLIGLTQTGLINDDPACSASMAKVQHPRHVRSYPRCRNHTLSVLWSIL